MASLTLLLGAALAGTATAKTFTACTAADIIAQGTGSCPASAAPCTINDTVEVVTTCLFDFGARDVTLTNNANLLIGQNSVTLLAGNFTIQHGGLIEGSGGTGGFLTIRTTGDIATLRTAGNGARIKLVGDGRGGNILLDAGGSISIDGLVQADNATADASGGSITMRAGGDIVTGATLFSEAIIDASGGGQACGGDIDLEAGGRIEINKDVSAAGGDGGAVDLNAAEIIINDKIVATGDGNAGSGGFIDMFSVSHADINATLESRGSDSVGDFGGGCGGEVLIDSDGSISIGAEITVRSGPPDGGAGFIELTARGPVVVEPTGILNAEGSGGESVGGEIFLSSSRADVTVLGDLLADGGDSGGDVSIDAGGDVELNARCDASGRSAGSFGGAVTAEAGVRGAGDVTVTDTIDVGGAICGAFDFCSAGGSVDLFGCDVTVAATAEIYTRAPGTFGEGGVVFLVARDLVTVDGSIDSSGGADFLEGENFIVHPTGVLPDLSGLITPAEILTARDPCTGVNDSPLCLTPCPLCGDGVVDFPETCDTAGLPPVSCDGCSTFCRIEDCDDGNACTTDACDPALGCRTVAGPDGVPCPDGDVCNGDEFCDRGVCQPGQGLPCDDGDTCTSDLCDPIAGCQNDPIDGAPCEDGDQCTVGDQCDAGGDCGPGLPRVCDDDNVCTVDSCNPVSGCISDPVPLAFTPCGPPGDECAKRCFLTCEDTPERCDDEDPCTTDVCDPVTGCVYTPSPGCGEPGLDHFLSYTIRGNPEGMRFFAIGPIELSDDFGTAPYVVRKPLRLLLPGNKNGEGVFDGLTHLQEYRIALAKGAPRFQVQTGVTVVNQCTDGLVEVKKPVSLLVPTSKSVTGPIGPPVAGDHELDHYLCYQANAQKKLGDGTLLPLSPAPGTQVVVQDQFQTRRYDLKRITKYCTPVATAPDSTMPPTILGGPDKGSAFPLEPASIRHPERRLVCYRAKQAVREVPQLGCGCDRNTDARCQGVKIEPSQARHVPRIAVHTTNQLEAGRIDTVQEFELCVPTTASPGAS